MQIKQPQGLKPKMRARKQRNGVNWQKEKGVTQMGVIQGLEV